MIRFYQILLFFFLLSPTYGQKKQVVKILVCSKTNGYRHASIPDAIKSLQTMGDKNGWNLTFSEDVSLFNQAFLDDIDVVVMLMTTDTIFNDQQKRSLERYVERGGGLVTLHCGTVTENDWPWWVDAMCCRFTGHPPVQEGELIIEDQSHPSTKHFKDSIWHIKDEFYSFDANPRSCANVLISIKEETYDVQDNPWFKHADLKMGDHPLVWYKKLKKGNVFQTALGHTSEAYSNPDYLKLIEGAILWSCKKRAD